MISQTQPTGPGGTFNINLQITVATTGTGSVEIDLEDFVGTDPAALSDAGSEPPITFDVTDGGAPAVLTATVTFTDVGICGQGNTFYAVKAASKPGATGTVSNVSGEEDCGGVGGVG